MRVTITDKRPSGKGGIFPVKEIWVSLARKLSHNSAFYKKKFSTSIIVGDNKMMILTSIQKLHLNDISSDSMLRFQHFTWVPPFSLYIVSTAFFIFTEVLTADNYPTSSVTVSINPFHRQGSFHADLMKFLVVNNTLSTIFLKRFSPTSTSFVLFNKEFHHLETPLFCSIKTFTDKYLLCFVQSPECNFLHRGLSPTS